MEDTENVSRKGTKEQEDSPKKRLEVLNEVGDQVVSARKTRRSQCIEGGKGGLHQSQLMPEATWKPSKMQNVNLKLQ